MKNLRLHSLSIIFMFAIVASLFSGCSNSTTSVVYAGSASFEHSTVTARVGDIILVESNTLSVFPLSTDSTPLFSSSNSFVARVNALSGEVECISEGTAVINALVKSSKDTYVGDSFEITVGERLVYATGFDLESEDTVFVDLDETDRYNELSLTGESINVLPIVTYSQMNIATYNYETGLITPIGEGIVTVYVSLELTGSNNLTKQFDIEVFNRVIYIDAITVYEANAGSSLLITYSVKDESQENQLATSQ
jgi:hypothetical protein